MLTLPRSARWWVLLTAVVLCGCGPVSSTGGHEKYVPSPETGRQAVQAVMEAWQRGEPTGTLQGTANPLLFVCDSYRQPGQRLERFEILGEVPGHTERCFLVRLSLSNPAREDKVRYAVLGIDPLWIYRHEDLELLAHWEHPMAPAASTTPPASPAPATPEPAR